MKNIIIYFTIIFALAASTACEAASRIGVVLMHGKTGRPDAPPITTLAGRLALEGFIVTIPQMPYARGRQYDESFEETMLDIDKETVELKKRGADKIIIAGHSLGASVALYYASIRAVDGVAAIAPGHRPEGVLFQERLDHDFERARELLKEGRGDEKFFFKDTNQGISSRIRVSPKIYLSWFDPASHAVMPNNTAALKPGTALLWVIGTKDPLYKVGSSYAFDKAPANARNQYIVVNSDHMDTPIDAAEDIVKWLKSFE